MNVKPYLICILFLLPFLGNSQYTVIEQSLSNHDNKTSHEQIEQIAFEKLEKQILKKIRKFEKKLDRKIICVIAIDYKCHDIQHIEIRRDVVDRDLIHYRCMVCHKTWSACLPEIYY